MRAAVFGIEDRLGRETIAVVFLVRQKGGEIVRNAGGNAALLAAQILAVADEDIRKRLDSKRAADAKKVLEKDAGVMEKLS